MVIYPLYLFVMRLTSFFELDRPQRSIAFLSLLTNWPIKTNQQACSVTSCKWKKKKEGRNKRLRMLGHGASDITDCSILEPYNSSLSRSLCENPFFLSRGKEFHCLINTLRLMLPVMRPSTPLFISFFFSLSLFYTLLLRIFVTLPSPFS